MTRNPLHILTWGLVLMLGFSSCSSRPKPETEAQYNLNVDQTLYVLDDVNNMIFAFDLETQSFVAHSTYANAEKWRSSDFDITPSGELIVAVYGIPSAFQTPSSELMVLDASTLSKKGALDVEIFPDRFEIDKNGAIYMSHAYEHLDESGWLVSVMDAVPKAKQNLLTVQGAPQPPIVAEDGLVYFPYFGAGDRHYGDSNVLVYDPESEVTHLLFPDDFTYSAPRDLAWDGETHYALFTAIQNEKPPYFTKPDGGGFNTADKILMTFAPDLSTFEFIPFEAFGSDMELIVHEGIAYIYYFDGGGGKYSGLVVLDIQNKKVLESHEFGRGTFSEEMALVGRKLYMTSYIKKGIDVFDIDTRTFSFVPLPVEVGPEHLAVGNFE
jgi:hypothetical protein